MLQSYLLTEDDVRIGSWQRIVLDRLQTNLSVEWERELFFYNEN